MKNHDDESKNNPKKSADNDANQIPAHALADLPPFVLLDILESMSPSELSALRLTDKSMNAAITHVLGDSESEPMQRYWQKQCEKTFANQTQESVLHAQAENRDVDYKQLYFQFRAYQTKQPSLSRLINYIRENNRHGLEESGLWPKEKSQIIIAATYAHKYNHTKLSRHLFDVMLQKNKCFNTPKVWLAALFGCDKAQMQAFIKANPKEIDKPVKVANRGRVPGLGIISEELYREEQFRPIEIAVIMGNQEAVAALLAAGATVNRGLIDLAVAVDNMKAVKLLYQSLDSSELDLTQQDIRVSNPITYALYADDNVLLKQFLATPNLSERTLKSTNVSQTPLLIAIKRGNTDAVEQLAEAMAKNDIKNLDYRYLIYAVLEDQGECIERLVEVLNAKIPSDDADYDERMKDTIAVCQQDFSHYQKRVAAHSQTDNNEEALGRMLNIAIRVNATEIIDDLIKQGVTVTAPDLARAAEMTDQETVLKLMSAWQDSHSDWQTQLEDALSQDPRITSQSGDDANPLCELLKSASEKQYTKVIQAWLTCYDEIKSEKLDLSKSAFSIIKSTLYQLSSDGDVDSLKQFLSSGLMINSFVNAAAVNGQFDVVDFFMKGGGGFNPGRDSGLYYRAGRFISHPVELSFLEGQYSMAEYLSDKYFKKLDPGLTYECIRGALRSKNPRALECALKVSDYHRMRKSSTYNAITLQEMAEASKYDFPNGYIMLRCAHAQSKNSKLSIPKQMIAILKKDVTVSEKQKAKNFMKSVGLFGSKNIKLNDLIRELQKLEGKADLTINDLNQLLKSHQDAIMPEKFDYLSRVALPSFAERLSPESKPSGPSLS